MALQELSIPEKAAFFPRYFKTGKGEYGEGDQFLGVSVPDSRKIAKHFTKSLSLNDLQTVIVSPWHEARLVALFILVEKFEKSRDQKAKEDIISFYLKNTQYINNWDLVDSSCYKIMGRFAYENSKPEILEQLSSSENIWEKRMAVVGTLFHIKKQDFDLPFKLITNNLHHSHDLMHKACGWMLREIGNKNENLLIGYLLENYNTMPRTSLRHAIEKLNEPLRQNFLKGKNF